MGFKELTFWAIIAYIIYMFISASPIAGSIITGLFLTLGVVQVYGMWPLEFIGIHLKGDMVLWNLAVLPVIFYFIGNYFYRKNQEEEEKIRNDEIVDYTSCPIEILSFSSINNVFTAGNNSITFKARNNSDSPKLFQIELFVNGEWRSSGYREFEIGSKELKTFDILGPAWKKAKDIRVSAWR